MVAGVTTAFVDMTDADMTDITPLCLLLAGGKSRRMGGGDKNLIMLGDRPLLAHVMGRAVPAGGPPVVNATGDPARLAGFGLPVVSDSVAGNAAVLFHLLRLPPTLRW